MTPANPWLPRRLTRRLSLGGVAIGGGAPVSVQSMTKTDTRNVAATVRQIRNLQAAGCDIVRLAVADSQAVAAFACIRARVDVPLVADIHFDYRLALAALAAGADGLRINPGNIGGADRVRAVAGEAKKRGTPIRIGVNSGSLERSVLRRFGGPTAEAMVESAMRHVRLLEAHDFCLIKISVKASDVPRTVEAYRLLSSQTDYPLHLGVTEAGTTLSGSVYSSAALAVLLAQGIGDTLRVSLSAPPLREVEAGRRLLQAMELRSSGPRVVACPTCGRTEVDVRRVAERLEQALAKIPRPDAWSPRAPCIAVMGCVVNGPGEAADADLALVGGRDRFLVFSGGRRVGEVQPRQAVEEMVNRAIAWRPGGPGGQ